MFNWFYSLHILIPIFSSINRSRRLTKSNGYRGHPCSPLQKRPRKSLSMVRHGQGDFQQPQRSLSITLWWPLTTQRDAFISSSWLTPSTMFATTYLDGTCPSEFTFFLSWFRLYSWARFDLWSSLYRSLDQQTFSSLSHSPLCFFTSSRNLWQSPTSHWLRHGPNGQFSSGENIFNRFLTHYFIFNLQQHCHFCDGGNRRCYAGWKFYGETARVPR